MPTLSDSEFCDFKYTKSNDQNQSGVEAYPSASCRLLRVRLWIAIRGQEQIELRPSATRRGSRGSTLYCIFIHVYDRVLLQYDRGAVRHNKPRAPILGQIESITV